MLRWYSSHTDTERKAYRLQSYVDEALGTKSGVWWPGISSLQRDGQVEYGAGQPVMRACAYAISGGGCDVQ